MQEHIASKTKYGGMVTENSQRTLERRVEYSLKSTKKKSRKLKHFHHGEITR